MLIVPENRIPELMTSEDAFEAVNPSSPRWRGTRLTTSR